MRMILLGALTGAASIGCAASDDARQGNELSSRLMDAIAEWPIEWQVPQDSQHRSDARDAANMVVSATLSLVREHGLVVSHWPTADTALYLIVASDRKTDGATRTVVIAAGRISEQGWRSSDRLETSADGPAAFSLDSVTTDAAGGVLVWTCIGASEERSGRLLAARLTFPSWTVLPSASGSCG